MKHLIRKKSNVFTFDVIESGVVSFGGKKKKKNVDESGMKINVLCVNKSKTPRIRSFLNSFTLNFGRFLWLAERDRLASIISRLWNCN